MIQDLNPNNQQTQPRVTLKDTAEVKCDECGNTAFTEAVMMRKVSRLLTSTPKDSYVPIPVFLCSACGHLNDEFLPAELKVTSSPSLIASK